MDFGESHHHSQQWWNQITLEFDVLWFESTSTMKQQSVDTLESVVQESLLPLPWSALLPLIQFCELTLSIWNSARCLTGGGKPSSFLEVALCKCSRVGLWKEAAADESEQCPCSLLSFGNKARKTPQAPLRAAVNHPRTPRSPYEYFQVFEDKKWVCFQSRIWRILLRSVWVDSRKLFQLVTCSGQIGWKVAVKS